ncbi:hypothetical protein [Mycobacterium sp. DL592]|uniref:hypothetical protein n=1 Tax=Mycobacterium sp. DL592 TaxID=2675524 RepID=UPI001FBA057E|nr:hypothetical protein [Mycobacterium sp. DL592]
MCRRLTVVAVWWIVALAAAPVCTAEPVWPVAGAESAAKTIKELEDQGYTVAMNLVAGDRSVSLSRCSVTAINNPDRSPDPAPTTSTTVYVDVSCPSHDSGDWDLGIGLGF